MSGVCLDALNKPPGRVALRHLGVDSVRIEIRDGTQYMDYVNSIEDYVDLYSLIGPSTNNVFPIIANTPRPQVIIIGNEPDGVGESSWQMSQQEYINLWNRFANDLRVYFPTTKLCTAGMVGNTEYLEDVWPYLDIKPDYVNKHYPNNKEEIREFRATFNTPCVIGEWCYKTATQQQMTDWVDMLHLESFEHFWFCWSEGMVSGMGLVSKTGHHLNAYYKYKKAIGQA